jgi:hypothetical protein
MRVGKIPHCIDPQRSGALRRRIAAVMDSASKLSREPSYAHINFSLLGEKARITTNLSVADHC